MTKDLVELVSELKVIEDIPKALTKVHDDIFDAMLSGDRELYQGAMFALGYLTTKLWAQETTQ